MARPWRKTKLVHNVVGLVLGAQLFLWVLSGLYFTIFPIDTIHGDHLRATIAHGLLDADKDYISLAEAERSAGAEARSGTLTMFLKQPVWEVRTSEDIVLVNAETGVKLSPIDASTATRIATEGMVLNIQDANAPVLLERNPPREYAGPLPAWVITYKPDRTKVYIPADTGRLQTISTREWRIFDVFWRFHIMDITGEDRIDTWWMKLASFFGLTMVISGIVLVIVRVRKGTILR